MNMSSRPPTPNVGRFTGIVLGFVVFVCVAMIGGTGYLKYQLDRAETTLAAPDNALGRDQDMFDRLRRDLGYGGFLGLAQNYVLTHDGSGFAEMKAHIKSADDIIAHLPDKTPAETRHELSAIVSAFDAALQKINAPAGDMAGEFTLSDLVPLYAALPILDARVTSGNAETRLAAQNQMQFWAMLLTLASWCSLIIASACAAGIYLTLRDKHSAPMRALAQSIQNMARGDMRTAIWGTERQDMIGELARAVDIARYHFSHLPDLSLLSEQGPVRMRFEGGSRSLFEAMMKAISRDSENIREHSSSLVEVISQQKQSIADLSGKVEAIMQTILQRGHNGDREIGQAIHEMIGSAENLKNAHAHAADQLNRLIPSLEDRAQGLAEIAHITGKQISQTLQSLAASESGMKVNAEHARDTLAKLSSTADDLGERLFGAINLLQASGKVLAETTEDIKGRFREGVSGAPDISADLTPLAQRLEQMTTQLGIMQTALAAQGDTQSDIVLALEKQLERTSVPTSSVMPTSPQTTSLDPHSLRPLMQRLEQIAAQIAVVQAKVEKQADLVDLEATISHMATTLPTEMHRNLHKELQNLSSHLVVTQGQLAQDIAEGSRQTLEVLNDKIVAVHSKLAEQVGLIETIEHNQEAKDTAQHSVIMDALANMATNLPTEWHRNLHKELQNLSAHLAVTQGQLAQDIAEGSRHTLEMLNDKIVDVHSKIAEQVSLIETIEHNQEAKDTAQHGVIMDALANLDDKLAAAAHHIPSVIQKNVDHRLDAVSAQMDAKQNAVMTTVIAEIHNDIVTTAMTIPSQIQQTLQHEFDQLSAKMDNVQIELGKPLPPIALPTELVQQMHDHWYQMAAQIEASRISIDKVLQQEVVTKLNAFEQTLVTTKKAVESTQFELSQPAPRHVYTLPPELQQQLLDQWFQMSAQLEASRANMIEAIADQIDKMETRMAGRSANQLSKTASDYATQRQIEQQTQILSELVATLSILDTHMQQIKSEIHASN